MLFRRYLFMSDRMDINKSVPQERWGEFFDQFADGNRGRQDKIFCSL
jgi:hypothetical protein